MSRKKDFFQGARLRKSFKQILSSPDEIVDRLRGVRQQMISCGNWKAEAEIYKAIEDLKELKLDLESIIKEFED